MSRDSEFLPPLEAAERLRPPFWAGWLLAAITLFTVTMILWAGWAEVAQVTRGEGRVIPSQSVQVIQSLEGGILTGLYVDQGDRVVEGAVLARLSALEAGADQRAAETRLRGLLAARARLQAEAEGRPAPIFDPDLATEAPALAGEELALFTDRVRERDEGIAVLDSRVREIGERQAETRAMVEQTINNLALTRRELEVTEQLVAEGVVSELEALRLRQALNEQQGRLNASRATLARLEEEKTGIEGQIEQARTAFRARARDELASLNLEIAALEEGEAARADRVARAELRAPVTGIVQSIAVKTLGGVVAPGQRLIEIVPSTDNLMIRARVRPSDVAFLRPGQPARVRITAYDHQRYGQLQARLVRISADAITERDGTTYFEIDAVTERAWLGTADDPLPITPGMVAEIAVVTDSRTVLDSVLKPVRTLGERALSEG